MAHDVSDRDAGGDSPDGRLHRPVLDGCVEVAGHRGLSAKDDTIVTTRMLRWMVSQPRPPRRRPEVDPPRPKMKLSNHIVMRMWVTWRTSSLFQRHLKWAGSLLVTGRQDALTGNHDAHSNRIIDGWHRWTAAAEFLTALARSTGIPADLSTQTITSSTIPQAA
jgi:hypothetical protein